jgi:hypothetical protein
MQGGPRTRHSEQAFVLKRLCRNGRFETTGSKWYGSNRTIQKSSVQKDRFKKAGFKPLDCGRMTTQSPYADERDQVPR